jgi:nitrogen fixation/metabolism regulation signal transduction histidine kinase
LPLTIAVGILVTFRIAGPVYRLKEFLKSIASGATPEDCRLRKGDELQDLCSLANDATAPLRGAKRGEAGDSRAAA